MMIISSWLFDIIFDVVYYGMLIHDIIVPLMSRFEPTNRLQYHHLLSWHHCAITSFIISQTISIFGLVLLPSSCHCSAIRGLLCQVQVQISLVCSARRFALVQQLGYCLEYLCWVVLPCSGFCCQVQPMQMSAFFFMTSRMQARLQVGSMDHSMSWIPWHTGS